MVLHHELTVSVGALAPAASGRRTSPRASSWPAERATCTRACCSSWGAPARRTRPPLDDVEPVLAAHFIARKDGAVSMVRAVVLALLLLPWLSQNVCLSATQAVISFPQLQCPHNPHNPPSCCACRGFT